MSTVSATITAPRGRFRELDGLRGIAVLLVVITHYTMVFDVVFPNHESSPVQFSAGSLGVQLFFMISGYVIFMTAERRRSPKSFALARAVRLYPTYWAALAITVPLSYLYLPPRPSALQIVANFSMLQNFLLVRDIDGAYWSLAREIVFYVLIALLLWAGAGRITSAITSWFVGVWTLAGLCIVAIEARAGSHLALQADHATAAEYAGLFGLGMLMYERRVGRRHSWTLIIIAAVGAVACTFLKTQPADALALAGLIGLFVVTTSREASRWLTFRPLQFVGIVSYPLYLVHQNVGYIVMDAIIPEVGRVPAMFLTFLALLVLAWVIHELIEKRLSHRLSLCWDRRQFQKPRVLS
ncbi:acyltransferase family protein [Dermacoccus barathri]|uniref:acyltransferase family protein n=1 Tax=Dermacoccus barathri TaxID=322601 RepID=UPI00187A8323|nr:acyltransferase [Dermacoccus barathri]MBE7370833.1 acyltransferase [Dermacoccus barathri]